MFKVSGTLPNGVNPKQLETRSNVQCTGAFLQGSELSLQHRIAGPSPFKTRLRREPQRCASTEQLTRVVTLKLLNNTHGPEAYLPMNESSDRTTPGMT